MLNPNEKKRTSPADLRKMFGANLRQLSSRSKSVSQLCRELGINRTQYNRYLAGESFPRPDVLHKICEYFSVDARILLEPVAEIDTAMDNVFLNPITRNFLGTASRPVPEDMFPSGLYRFTRRSFMQEGIYVVSIAKIYRSGMHTYVRGFELKEAMRQQGLGSSGEMREYRGVVLPQEGGVAMLLSRRRALSVSFSFAAPQVSFEHNYFVGFTALNVRESPGTQRISRLVLEHLSPNWATYMEAARSTGFRKTEEVPAYHRAQLQIDRPFQ